MHATTGVMAPAAVERTGQEATHAAPQEEPRPRARRQWTAAEKADCLALFADSGLTVAEFCREMEVPEATLGLWRRQARGEGPASAVSGGAAAAMASDPAFAAVEVVSSEAPVVGRGAPRGPRAMILRWPTGFETHLTGLDLPTMVALVRVLLRTLGAPGGAGSVPHAG